MGHHSLPPPPHSPVWPEWVLRTEISRVRTHVWVTTAYRHHPTALCGQSGCLEQRFPVSGHMYGSPQPGPAHCHHPTALCGQSGCLEQRFPVSGHMYGSPQPGPAYCHHPTALCGQSGCLEQRFPVSGHMFVACTVYCH